MPFVRGKLRWMVAAALVLAAPVAGASVVTFATSLSGAAEAPPNGSGGSGSATLLIDTLAHTMTLEVAFFGLTGLTTASHIHCCTAVSATGAAGVATQVPTFSGFPGGVSSGSYTNTFDLTLPGTWNPPFVAANGGVAGAEAALLAGLADQRAYLNIHTTAFPGGEIRGFLVRQVPEPGALALLALGLGGFVLAAAGRRAQR